MTFSLGPPADSCQAFPEDSLAAFHPWGEGEELNEVRALGPQCTSEAVEAETISPMEPEPLQRRRKCRARTHLHGGRSSGQKRRTAPPEKEERKMSKKIPGPPIGTRVGGARLWSSILEEYELEEHELALLREAVRLVDVLDALDRVVRAEGVLHDTPQGLRAHPAVVESRQQKIALARLLAALRLPAGEEDAGETRRPQRRVGVRGMYAIRGAK